MTLAQRNNKLRTHQDKIESRVRLSADMLKSMGINPAAFERVALNALIINPAIGDCSPASVEKVLVQAMNAGLMLDNREAAIVPRKGEATLVPMVDGLVKLADKAMPGIDIWARVVYQSDSFDHSEGIRPQLDHRPNPSGSRADSDVVAAYAVARVPGHLDPTFEVMYRGEIDRIRAKSASEIANRPGPWRTDYPEMCRKTVIKRMLKRMPRGNASALVTTDDYDYVDTGVDNYDPIPAVEIDEAEYQQVDTNTGEIVNGQASAWVDDTNPSAAMAEVVEEQPPLVDADDDDDSPF